MLHVKCYTVHSYEETKIRFVTYQDYINFFLFHYIGKITNLSRLKNEAKISCNVTIETRAFASETRNIRFL